jgi:hypothetical protein
VLRAVEPTACDCPNCTGDPSAAIDLSPPGDQGEFAAQLMKDAAHLVECVDPLEAQLAGGMFVAMDGVAAWSAQASLIGSVVPLLEAQATVEALALLTAIGSVAPDPGGKDAMAAADRLAEAGISRPRWVAELGEPVIASDCVRLMDRYGHAWALGCRLHRAGRSHAVVIGVGPDECGEASQIVVADPENLPDVIASVKSLAREDRVRLREDALDPADFRWEVEKALDARAVHDAEDPAGLEVLTDEDGPPYEVLAPVLLEWISRLPDPGRPPARHRDGDADIADVAELLSAVPAIGGSGGPFGLLARAAQAKLPAKRTKSNGPAPVFVLKVALRGARPPIWRRLEVPGDLTLARLHQVIQIAFGWEDYHLHVFHTPFGDFGVSDRDLGHRAEGPVTLEQVVPGTGEKITYTYDFGDGWEHEITVEKVLDPPAGERPKPRCTGGRRAGPPEDCGGVWGYADLVEILGDPSHPDHRERLEWLGLDSAADFDPAALDTDKINKDLSTLR